MRNYVNNLAWQYPKIAAPFAEALTNPNQRNNAIQTIASDWLRIDPAAAAKWLANTSLPDPQKQNLLNSVKP